jgi:hypothetical protein
MLLPSCLIEGVAAGDARRGDRSPPSGCRPRPSMVAPICAACAAARWPSSKLWPRCKAAAAAAATFFSSFCEDFYNYAIYGLNLEN